MTGAACVLSVVGLLSGAVGGSSLGRHLRIFPRVELGEWLHRRGATALMDVSDGLALDLSRIAEASGVRIDLDRVPVHDDALRLARTTGRDPRDHALFDGEDHELLATVPGPEADRILGGASRRFPGLRAIGRVRRGRGLRIRERDDTGAPVPWSGEGGWLHGD